MSAPGEEWAGARVGKCEEMGRAGRRLGGSKSERRGPNRVLVFFFFFYFLPF
jgi:hypothetical protein